MAKKSTPESLVLKAVCDYLAYKKYSFFRINNIPSIQNDKYGFRMRKMPKYSMKGVADILVLKNGQAIFVEIKSYKGEMSEDQLKFEEFVEKAGCKYYLVRSVDDLIYYGF